MLKRLKSPAEECLEAEPSTPTLYALYCSQIRVAHALLTRCFSV